MASVADEDGSAEEDDADGALEPALGFAVGVVEYHERGRYDTRALRAVLNDGSTFIAVAA